MSVTNSLVWLWVLLVYGSPDGHIHTRIYTTEAACKITIASAPRNYGDTRKAECVRTPLYVVYGNTLP